MYGRLIPCYPLARRLHFVEKIKISCSAGNTSLIVVRAVVPPYSMRYMASSHKCVVIHLTFITCLYKTQKSY